jgi:hypothetical protein
MLDAPDYEIWHTACSTTVILTKQLAQCCKRISSKTLQLLLALFQLIFNWPYLNNLNQILSCAHVPPDSGTPWCKISVHLVMLEEVLLSLASFDLSNPFVNQLFTTGVERLFRKVKWSSLESRLKSARNICKNDVPE